MNKSQKILLISNIVLLGFFFAVVFHYVLGFYVGLGHFFNTFLSEPKTAFEDFTAILPRIKDLAPYSPPAEWQNYFPLSFVILFPFSLMENGTVAYAVFALIFIGVFVYLNIKNLACEDLGKMENFKNIFILSILTYPFLYLIDRGNFDMVIFIFLAGFVYFFKKEKYKVSAILLALANAMKPFPFLFLTLFLIKKKYKEFFISLAVSALLIVGSFFFFKGNVIDQICVLIQSWVSYSGGYVAYNDSSYGMVNGSSLYIFLKLIFCQLTQTPLVSPLLLFKIYNILNLVILALVVFLTFREKLFWKQLFLITSYMVFIPPAVYDYKLIFLFLPLWFFVNSEGKSKFAKFDLAYAILFSLFLIPKYFVIPQFLWGIEGRAFSISLILNIFILFIFVGIIIFEQFSLRKIRKNGNEEINL